MTCIYCNPKVLKYANFCIKHVYLVSFFFNLLILHCIVANILQGVKFLFFPILWPASYFLLFCKEIALFPINFFGVFLVQRNLLKYLRKFSIKLVNKRLSSTCEEFEFRGWYDVAFRLGQETHQILFEFQQTRWASRSKSRSRSQDVSSLAFYRRRIPNRKVHELYAIKNQVKSQFCQFTIFYCI